MTKDRSLGILQTILQCHAWKFIKAVSCLPQNDLLITMVHTGHVLVNRVVVHRTYHTCLVGLATAFGVIITNLSQWGRSYVDTDIHPCNGTSWNDIDGVCIIAQIDDGRWVVHHIRPCQTYAHTYKPQSKHHKRPQNRRPRLRMGTTR